MTSEDAGVICLWEGSLWETAHALVEDLAPRMEATSTGFSGKKKTRKKEEEEKEKRKKRRR